MENRNLGPAARWLLRSKSMESVLFACLRFALAMSPSNVTAM